MLPIEKLPQLSLLSHQEIMFLQELQIIVVMDIGQVALMTKKIGSKCINYNIFISMFGGLRTIGGIVINWKYPAKVFSILVRGEHDWEPFLDENEAALDVNYEFTPRIASGIMIEMNQFDFAASK